MNLNYDASITYPDTLEDAEAAIGKRATITLTGCIVDAGRSDAGAYVKFEVDPRWGFSEGHKLVMDLAAFEIHE